MALSVPLSLFASSAGGVPQARDFNIRRLTTRLPEHCHRKHNQMTKLRVESFTLSIDGFGAGTDQSLENPLGVGGTALHGWAFATRTFQSHLFGNKDGETGY